MTVKSKDGEQFFLVVCDSGCKVKLQSETVEPLPDPWRVIELVGWCGEFHACSERCEAIIRERYEQKGKP